MDYTDLVPSDLLKQAGLSANDFDVSIRLAWQLSEAVKMRRTKLREESVLSSEGSQQRVEREQREQAEDDRIFLGAALLLAQRMKPKKR